MTYRGVILDLDGTVYRGPRLISGADEGVERLRSAGVDLLFLSNKAIQRRESYVEKLRGLGVEVDLDDVLNSASIAADYLAERHPGARVLVVGERPLEAELAAAGLRIADAPEEVDVLLTSMDREFDYATLTDAMVALDADPAPAFYATNPDRTCPDEEGEVPDAAGMTGAIEGVTGRKLDRVLGKPSSVTIDVALDRLGVPPSECLIVGDRLDTDIAMGECAGMTTVLVLSGVTDEADLASSSVEPDHVVDSLGEIDDLL